MTRPRSSATPVTSVAGVVACVGAVVLVVLLATWAASGGTDPVFRGDGRPAPTERAAPTPTVEPEDPGAAAEQEARERGPEEPPAWARVVSAALQVAAALGALYLLLRIARAAVRHRAPGRRRPDDPTADAPEPLEPEQLLVAMTADAGTQEQLLGAGRTDDAIVACWHRFEVQAARAGLAREPWETSTEFVRRLLRIAEVDPDVVAELARLYREARHSDHELGDDDRRRAAAALAALHAQVRSRRRAGQDAR